MQSSLLCRIQHHPSRAALLPDLKKALAPLPVEVIRHESIPPDPWGGYKQCLSSLPDCSHVLIIQDDAQPVPNFAQALEKVAERNLNTPVCLFMGALPADTAVRAKRMLARNGRKPYIPLGPSGFVPLVAVLWPRAKAQEFLIWSRANKMTRADDGNCARWMRRTRQPFLVAVPSLVQHNDDAPTVKGGREHVPWKEGWRQALFLAEDALEYEW